MRVEFSRATSHPLKAAATRQTLGTSFSLQKRKKTQEAGGSVCAAMWNHSFSTDPQQLCLNKHRD